MTPFHTPLHKLSLTLSFLVLTSLSCSSSQVPNGSTPEGGSGDTGENAKQRSWRALSDMDNVSAMTTTEEHLWVGTSGGLLRYPLDGGTPLRLSGSTGPGQGRIVAANTDAEGRLWALSEGGLGRFEGGAWSRPAGAVPEAGDLTAMLVSSKNAVWVGGSKGLLVFKRGSWSRWTDAHDITALAQRAGNEEVWVGTTDGALLVSPDGMLTHHSMDRGMPCESVRSMITLESEVWAICSRSDGAVLARFDGNRWQGFSAKLTQRPMDLARCRDSAVLLTEDGLWRIAAHDPEEEQIADGEVPLSLVFEGEPARPQRTQLTPSTPPDGSDTRNARGRATAVGFAPTPPEPDDPWEIRPTTQLLRPVDVPVYHGANLVECDSRGVWIGTEGLGATRIARGGQVTVYRTLDLVVTERPFSVAADGEGNAWFLSRDLRAGVLGGDSGDRFEPSLVEQDATSGIQVLAFGSRGMGAYALGKRRGTNVIRIYQHVRGEWVEMLERELGFGAEYLVEEDEDDPEARPQPPVNMLADFSFFEVDPEGRFWIGLLLRPRSSPEAQPIPHGVMVLDLESEGVIYHSQIPYGPGSLQIPNEINVIDFTDQGDVWLGGLNGALVIRADGSMDRFTEANVLHGEIVNDLAIDAEGTPWVATPEGLGRYQQNSWRFFIDNMPRNIHVQSLAVDSRGELWAGGNRGAVHYDGRTWEVLTSRSGLISNRVHSIHVDGRDRIWFVTQAGISLLEREAQH